MLEGMVRSQNSSKMPFAGAARRLLRFGAIRGMRSIEIDPEVFRRELSERHGLWVPSLARLREVPTEHLDTVAAKLIRDAERLALVEGAGLGLGGIITFLPDASFLTIITLRLIQRLALLYGFETRESEQRIEMWKAAAAANIAETRGDRVGEGVASRVPSVPIRRPSVAAGDPLARARSVPLKHETSTRALSRRAEPSRADPLELNAASASTLRLESYDSECHNRKCVPAARSARSTQLHSLECVRFSVYVAYNRGTSRKTARTASASDISDRSRATSAWVARKSGA